MTILNETTVIVFTSAELKSCLEGTNGYSIVYLGANISLSSGINISSSKQNLIIDGTYDGTTYQLEDRKSSAAGDTIRVSAVYPTKVVVQNMNIIGYNYYGVIYVPEASTYQNTIIEYNNITYIGPQISFHPYGLTRFIDCNITIQDNYNTGNEVAECNKIEIGGETTIIHKSSGNSSFWFRNANPSLKILKNSLVNFTSEKRELFYGINNLEFIISKGATFKVTSYAGMAYGTFGTGTTTIEDGATLEITKTNYNGSYPTWYSYGIITINEGANLSIINNYSGITTSNYNIYFSGSSSGLILNKPNRLILYNKVANVLYASTTITFSFSFNRINLFNNVINIDSSISLSTLPNYTWYKNSETSVISGTFNATSTTITNNNFTEEELATLPALSNFIFPNKKIFSLGDFSFNVNALTDKDTKIMGITKPNTSILIQYNNLNEITVADEKGEFSYTYDEALPIGTQITFQSKLSNELIYHTKVIEIVYSGELIIDSATEKVTFLLEPISIIPLL